MTDKTQISDLDRAIRAAGIPIVGVSGNNDGSQLRVDFAPQATAQQRTDAAAIAAAFDYSDAAADARKITRIRAAAATALDNERGEMIAISRASLLEMLDYANRTRAALNSLLTWLGNQAGLTNKAQLAAMQRPEATPAQAKTAVKNRLAAGEGDPTE